MPDSPQNASAPTAETPQSPSDQPPARGQGVTSDHEVPIHLHSITEGLVLEHHPERLGRLHNLTVEPRDCERWHAAKARLHCASHRNRHCGFVKPGRPRRDEARTEISR